MNKFECMKGVFGSDLKPRARLVLQCLIYHADKDGSCFSVCKNHSRRVRLRYFYR